MPRCPRCSTTLQLKDSPSYAIWCDHCGGAFLQRVYEPKLSNELSADWQSLADTATALESDAENSFEAWRPVQLKCPSCQQHMARRNFLKASGAIAHQCVQHGTWFDGGQLAKATNYLSHGGAERSARIIQEREASVDASRDRLARIEQAAKTRKAITTGRPGRRWFWPF